MECFDILILVLGIVTGVILFALGLPFHIIVIYYVAIMFFCWYAYSNNFWYCKVDKKL